MGTLTQYRWWISIIKREYLILFCQKELMLQALLFFLMFSIFFPLTLPYDLGILHELFPGIVWFSACFAIFLACEHLYAKDLDSGYLEQWLVHHKPLSVYVYIKILVHGGFIFASILLAILVLSIIYHLSWQELGVTALSLGFGLPGLIGFTAMVSAFGVFGPGRSMVMLLVLLPLILPILILGSAVISLFFAGSSIVGLLALLAAFSIAVLMFIPVISAFILKICLQ